jgi:hypothetical protein
MSRDSASIHTVTGRSLLRRPDRIITAVPVIPE